MAPSSTFGSHMSSVVTSEMAPLTGATTVDAARSEDVGRRIVVVRPTVRRDVRRLDREDVVAPGERDETHRPDHPRPQHSPRVAAPRATCNGGLWPTEWKPIAWKRRALGRPGRSGVPTSASGNGAPSARTTASTATRGSTSPTTRPAPAPTSGARTASPGSATTPRSSASRSRCGTGSTRSSRSGSSASPMPRGTTART